MAVTQRDLDLMAWTLLGEAAGEGDKGMQAVANVIVNRARSGQYPSSIGKVVLQPKQFSTWNKGEGGNNPTQYSKNSDAFQRARAIAEAAVNGQLPDITGGALNYWAPRGMKGGKDPVWARGVPESDRLRIGNHVFLTQHPVPPAPLTAEAPPVPATMSPELAFASNRSQALDAIQQLVGTGGPATGGIEQAYAGSGNPANAGIAAAAGPQLPMPKPTDLNAFAPRDQRLPPSQGLQDIPQGAPIIPQGPQGRGGQRAPVVAPAQQFPLPDLNDPLMRATVYGPDRFVPRLDYDRYFDRQRLVENAPSGMARATGAPDLRALGAAIPASPAQAQTQFASDDALKRLAAAKQQQGLLLQSPQAAAAASYDPMAALAPTKGQNILDELASSGPYSIAPAKPRITLADIMGTPARAAGTQRTASTVYVRPDGTETTATRAGSNEQPMPGRPSSVPPAPPRSPLLGGPTPAARTSLGEMMGTVRPVTNLVTPPPAPGSVPGLTGFGATPVGGGMPAAPMPSLAPPVPAQRPQKPVVNAKGFFLGNPFGDYQVKKGETLGKIAKKFGTTVDNLATVNNIPDPAKIKAGARLVVTNPSVAPVTPAPRPASRTSSSSSSSSSSSTPVYTPPKQTTTSATKVSIPVYSSASITPAKTVTPAKPVTKPTLSQMMGTSLKEGGPVGYAYGGYIPGGTNVPVPGPQYSQDAQRMANALKTVDVASRVIPYVSGVNTIASTFAPKETWEAKGAIANQLALAGTAASAAARNRSSSSTPMMDGSPSSSRSSNRDNDDRDANKGKDKSGSSSSSGGIDGVIGTYNPPTQAQIDALYAPYFRQAVMPGAGYNPGVSGEFNYFPQATAAPASGTGTGTGTGTPAPASSKAVEWFNTFASNLGDRSKREEARKVMADAKTSFYDLFRRYRNSLGRKANPTLEGWQTYLSGKGYAKGGAVSSEPRLVLGQGGPTGDKIPARIDNKTEARLSNGEFVMTAAAVRGLGGGDYARGAEALMRLNDQFDPRHNKGTLKVEKVR